MATAMDLHRDLGSLFAALVDPTRRQVVETLTAGPRRAGELAEASGVTPSAMSRHLRVLLEAGVVVDQRPADDARVRLFQLRPGSMDPLNEWLDQLQAQWEEQLDAFKRHVESRGSK